MSYVVLVSKNMLCRFVGVARRASFPTYQKTQRLGGSNYATSTSKSKINEEDDAPIKFTSSAAKSWQAKSTRIGREDSRLWYEPYVILASISVFMIYFTLLREENDVDEELTKSLYSRIEGLEEHQLKVSLAYNREHNRDTSSIIRRLQEIEEEKRQNV